MATDVALTKEAMATEQRWWPALLSALVLAAIAAFALREILLTASRQFPGTDTGNLYAWEVFTRSVLAGGRLPFWNPYAFAGTPHLADTQTTVLYPPALLMRLVLPPVPYFTALIVFHVWVSGLGGLLLGRVAGLRWPMALAVGIATMFGGSIAGWIHNGHLLLLSSAAWTPWVLALAILATRRDSLRPPVGLVAVLVLQFLAGYIQGSIYVAGMVAAWFWYEALRSEAPRRYRLVLQLAVLGIVAGGVAAFQLLPTVRLVAEAGRTTGIPYSTAVAAAWTWSDLSSFFYPDANASDRAAYVGWLLVCCAPFAFLDTHRRHLAGFFALVVAAAIAITLGDRLFLYRLHYAVFPGFRIPGRILIVATPALAACGAIGVERILSFLAPRESTGAGVTFTRRLISWAVVIAVAVDLAAHVSGPPAYPNRSSPAEVRNALGPPDGGRILTACDNRVNGVDFVMAGFPTITGIGSVYLRGFSEYNERMTSAGPFPARRDLWDAANVTRIVSCQPLSAPAVHLEARQGPFLIYRNDSAWPRASWTCDLERLTEWEVSERLREGRYENRRLMREDRVNIRWKADLTAPDRLARENRYRLEQGERREGSTWRYMLADVSRDNLQALLNDSAVEDTHGIDREKALVAPPSDRENSRTQMLFGTKPCSSAGQVAVESSDAADGYVRARVSAAAAGYAVFSEAYYPERRAYVDGQRVPLWRTNLAFSSVAVPAGTHHVELRYVPTSFYAGLAISLVTLMAWARSGRVRR